MTGDFSRADRVGSLIQRELADLIRDLKGAPRGLVTVQEVRVSRDLAHAKVFFTVLSGDPEETRDRLRRAAGHLRHELGHRLRLRSVPELQFAYDTSIEEGERLDSLIKAAVTRDQAHDSETTE